MHYAWKANRDAGSVSSHRNPDTKRRHGCTNIPKVKAHKGRAGWKSFIHAAFPELSTGLYDVSLARTVRGWDAGDPLTNGDAQLVYADPTEDPFEYPEVPEYVWDAMFATTCGLDDDYVY